MVIEAEKGRRPSDQNGGPGRMGWVCARLSDKPALEPPRNEDDARKVLDQHPLKEQIMAWQRIADQAKKKT
jgi:hypothetical protein